MEGELMGRLVEFPVALGDYLEGRVIRHDDETYRLVVEESDGERWNGYGYQVLTVEG